MNKIFLFCICCGFTFLISCKESKKNSPQLNKSQFSNMLIDIHIADATLTSQNIYRSGKNYQPSYYYNSIYKKYNITPVQFDSCMSYYSSNTKEFTKMYDQIIDSLNRLETKFRIEVKNAKLERDTVNLWTGKKHWRVPVKDKNTLDFAIPIKEKGIYTVRASIKIFKDDQTDNPRMEAYYWKQDSLGEAVKIPFDTVFIAKNMKFNSYEMQLEYPDTTYTQIRGNFFAGENDLVEFTQHFEIKDIMIFNPLIKPDTIEFKKELELKRRVQ